MGFGHAQIGEQLSDQSRLHRRSLVGMQRKLVAIDLVFDARVLDQPQGEASRFSFGQHPADHIPAEDIDDHVEVKIGPLDRTQELGDIPRPYLIGLGC